jgi:polysaccharide export outer membrane protein
MAGGVTPDAGPTVRITRRLEWGPIPLPDATQDANSGFSTAEVDLRLLLDAKNPGQNVVIRPHDVISVPRAEMVYIVGEVAKPGPLPLSGGHSISVMEAVSSSGGVLRLAAPSRALIVRRTPGGDKRVELEVNLKQIMQGKSKDVQLEAGDILVIPENTGKRVTGQIVTAVVVSAISVGMWALMYR